MVVKPRPPGNASGLEAPTGLDALLARPATLAVIQSATSGALTVHAGSGTEAALDLEAALRFLEFQGRPVEVVLLPDGRLVVHVELGARGRLWVLFAARAATPADLDAAFGISGATMSPGGSEDA